MGEKKRWMSWLPTGWAGIRTLASWFVALGALTTTPRRCKQPFLVLYTVGSKVPAWLRQPRTKSGLRVCDGGTMRSEAATSRPPADSEAAETSLRLGAGASLTPSHSGCRFHFHLIRCNMFTTRSKRATEGLSGIYYVCLFCNFSKEVMEGGFKNITRICTGKILAAEGGMTRGR